MNTFKLPMILDGATGTELQRRGMPAGCCSEKWILENPDAIGAIQRAYVDAGSDAVYAPTFGANRVSLRSHGVTAGVRDYCLRLVELTRKAADGRALVGGDMSPCGLRLPPMGDSSFDELVDVFTEQAAALEEAGVDLFAVETQMSLAEARASVLAVRSVSEKPVFVSFTCGPTGRGIFGEDLTSALLALQDMGVSAFGVNCCGDLELLASVLSAMLPYSDIPLIAKPNAGLPDMSTGRAVYRMTPPELAGRVPALAAAGTRIFGGCCGTNEAHIAALRDALSGMALPCPKAEITTVCASAYNTVRLTPDTRVRELAVSGDMADDAAGAIDAGAELLRVELRDMADVDIIESEQYALRAPLAVECSDGELLARFTRVYNGKPVVL